MQTQYQKLSAHNYKHITLVTKYRRNVMTSEFVKMAVQKAIEQVCEKHRIQIEIINVQDEHVHILVDCPSHFSNSKIIHLIKGGSAYLLFREIPYLHKVYPKRHFWSRGYFCRNVAETGYDYSNVFNYIKNQDQHYKRRNQ